MKKKHIASIIFYVGILWVLEGVIIGVAGLDNLVAIWSIFGGIILFVVGLVLRKRLKGGK